MGCAAEEMGFDDPHESLQTQPGTHPVSHSVNNRGYFCGGFAAWALTPI